MNKPKRNFFELDLKDMIKSDPELAAKLVVRKVDTGCVVEFEGDSVGLRSKRDEGLRLFKTSDAALRRLSWCGLSSVKVIM